MRRRLGLLASLGLVAIVASCRSTDGVIARYTLERELWRAQLHQRRIQIGFLRAHQMDLERAISALGDVVAHDPLADPRALDWDPAVVEDIRQILTVSRIGLANLYFLSGRYADAGSLYEQTLALGTLTFERALDARLGIARSMYLADEPGAVEEQCAAIFREVASSDAFWRGEHRLDEVFLNIPVVIVRMYRQSGNVEQYEEYSRVAADFYGRLVETRPDTPEAARARLGLLYLYLAREEWGGAAREIESILASPTQAAGNPDALMLLHGELHAFALGDSTSARRILDELIRRHPGSASAHAARYDIGALMLAAGDVDGAIAAFGWLEREPGVTPAIVARSMLARGVCLERRGRWDEALTILRRLIDLYPETPAAIDAPLVIARHYVERGERVLAERTLEHAREQYLNLIDRGSQFRGDRALLQDALVQSYALVGRRAEVASLLGSGSPRWDDATAAEGMLRSADLYLEALGDRDNAAKTLKKCIERFPDTRYANMARRRLDELSSRP